MFSKNYRSLFIYIGFFCRSLFIYSVLEPLLPYVGPCLFVCVCVSVRESVCVCVLLFVCVGGWVDGCVCLVGLVCVNR